VGGSGNEREGAEERERRLERQGSGEKRRRKWKRDGGRKEGEGTLLFSRNFR